MLAERDHGPVAHGTLSSNWGKEEENPTRERRRHLGRRSGRTFFGRRMTAREDQRRRGRRGQRVQDGAGAFLALEVQRGRSVEPSRSKVGVLPV